ncbi:MAG: VOC family protein [Kineosporiaceae bacterium]
MMIVNLPVADVARSRAFFADLGFAFNEQFSDSQAACMVVNDSAFAMLLDRDFFGTFTPRPVADAAASTEVIVAVSAASRADVDRIVEAAVTAGGREARPPLDEGFMYQRSIADLDGHVWEMLWMAAPEGGGEEARSPGGGISS